MAELISQFGTIATAIFSQVGTVASTIVSTPLLLFTTGVLFWVAVWVSSAGCCLATRRCLCSCLKWLLRL